MIETRLARGELLRVRYGVYLAASAWPENPSGRHLVLAHAEQAANPGAVLCGASAGVVWGLPSPELKNWHEQPVCITFPEGHHQSRSSAATHRTVRLPRTCIVVDAEGYDVTSLARTAVDLARGRELPQALVVLDAAARLLCATFVASPRRRDFANPHLAAAARAALDREAGHSPTLTRAIQLSDPRRESPAESLSAGHFVLAGLPTPEFQARITTSRGTFFADFLWREQRLIGECDGASKYSDPAERLNEKHREQLLRDEGFTFVRWLGGEIFGEPHTVTGRVARAL